MINEDVENYLNIYIIKTNVWIGKMKVGRIGDKTAYRNMKKNEEIYYLLYEAK